MSHRPEAALSIHPSPADAEVHIEQRGYPRNAWTAIPLEFLFAYLAQKGCVNRRFDELIGSLGEKRSNAIVNHDSMSIATREGNSLNDSCRQSHEFGET